MWNRQVGNDAEQVLGALETTPGRRSRHTPDPDTAGALAGRTTTARAVIR